MSTARQVLIRVIRTAMQGVIAWAIAQAVPVFDWFASIGLPVDETEVAVTLNTVGFAVVVWLLSELEKWIPLLSKILSLNLAADGPTYSSTSTRV